MYIALQCSYHKIRNKIQVYIKGGGEGAGGGEKEIELQRSH